MNKRIYTIISFFLLIIMSSAFSNIFLNEDRQGYNSFMNKEYEMASKKFKDLHWKGLSLLKNAKFDQAIDVLSKVSESIDGKYNLGNAYALNGDLDEAIETYKEVLEEDPNCQDAKYNLSVIEKLKKESEKNNKDCGCKNKDKSKQKKDNKDKKHDPQDQKSKEKDTKDSKKEKEKKKEKKDAQDEQKNKPEKKEDPQTTEQQKKQSKRDPREEASQNKIKKYDEKQQADEQWLRSIPDDPGGLLRQKFLRDHLNRRGS